MYREREREREGGGYKEGKTRRAHEVTGLSLVDPVHRERERERGGGVIKRARQGELMK